MNKIYNKTKMVVATLLSISTSLPLGGLGCAFTSCTDWSDHYDELPVQGSGQTVMQVLEQHVPDFASQVREAGYADLLESSQSFTVFAPMETQDIADVHQMVSNHIARHVWPTSTQQTMGVEMLNGKIYEFDASDSFAGTAISVGNKRADNGLVHLLHSPIIYVNNIYEHLQSNPQYTKVYNFIHQFDEIKFDLKASTEIDIDEQGRPVYDSVMVAYNRLLEHPIYGLGAIDREDSVFTMVVPTNEAWDLAYKRIAPSFKVYDSDEHAADSLQDIRTCLAIMGNLIYRDTVPSFLQAGTTAVKASNGTILSTPTLNLVGSETWNRPISVEAEQQNGRTYNNTLTSVYMRNITAASQVEGVSGDSYIEVQPVSASTNPTVIFDMPGVLAGAYNIYAVFLPATVEGPTAETDSTRISFTVTYLNTNGRTTSKRNTTKTLVTSGSKVTRMLAFERLEIPVSNTTDRLWLMDETHDASSTSVTTQLTITTNVTAKEFSSGELSRSFRLDRIVFEPVE